MASTTNRWKLGLFVVSGMAVGAAALLWLGASRLQRDSIEANCFFDEVVNGLEVGAPVKFRGVTIGKVVSIRTAPDQRHVQVISDIYIDALEQLGLPTTDRPSGPTEGPFVPPDLRAQLITSFVTNVSFIQTDFFDVTKHPVPDYPFEVPWNTIHTTSSSFKNLEAGLLDLVDRAPSLLEESTGLVRDLRGQLQELDMARLSDETLAAISRLDELLVRLSGEDGPLRRLTDRYDAVGARLEDALGGADLPATTASIRRMGEDLQRSSAEFGLLTGEVRSELDALWRTLESVRRLVELLERDPGALLHGRSTAQGTR